MRFSEEFLKHYYDVVDVLDSIEYVYDPALYGDHCPSCGEESPEHNNYCELNKVLSDAKTYRLRYRGQQSLWQSNKDSCVGCKECRHW